MSTENIEKKPIRKASKSHKKARNSFLYLLGTLLFLLWLTIYMKNIGSSEIYYFEASLENYSIAEISFISYGIDSLDLGLFKGDVSDLKVGDTIYIKEKIAESGLVEVKNFSNKKGFREKYFLNASVLEIGEDSCYVKYRSLPYGLNSNQVRALKINQDVEESYGFIGIKLKNHKSYGFASFDINLDNKLQKK